MMRAIRLALLCLGMALLCAAARGDEWRQFGHDVHHTQASEDTVKLPLTELWSWQPTANGPSVYGAAVAYGGLYYYSRGGVRIDDQRKTRVVRVLNCVHAKTGATIWTAPLESLQLSSPLSDAVAPAVDTGMVFAYDRAPAYYLTLISAQRGRQQLQVNGDLDYETLFEFLTRLGATDATLANMARSLLNYVVAWVENDGQPPPNWRQLQSDVPNYREEKKPLDQVDFYSTFNRPSRPEDRSNGIAGEDGRLEMKITTQKKDTAVLRVFSADRGLPGPHVYLRKARLLPTPLLQLRHPPLANVLGPSSGHRAVTPDNPSDWLGAPLLSSGTLRAAAMSDVLVTWKPDPDPRKDPLTVLQLRHPLQDLSPAGVLPTALSGFPLLQGPQGLMLGTDAYHRFFGLVDGGSAARTWHLDLHTTLGIPTAGLELIYVPLGGQPANLGIAAVDGQTGAVAWQYPPDARLTDPPNAPRGALEKKLHASFWSNPGLVLARGHVYGEVDGVVVALNPGTGKLDWQHALPAGFGVRSLCASADHLFLCVSPMGKMRQPLWEESLKREALLLALDLQTGKLEWGEIVPKPGNVIAAGGMVYLLDGGIHAYGPAERTFRLAAGSSDPKDYRLNAPAEEKEPAEAMDESHLSAPAGTDADPPKPAVPNASREPQKEVKKERSVADATILRLRYDEPRETRLARLRERRQRLPGTPLILSLDRLDATRAHWVDAAAQPPFTAEWTAEYAKTCAELAEAGRPEHFEVLPEINVYLTQYPQRFPEVQALGIELVRAVHAASPTTQVVFSFNAEVLSGRYARGDYRPFDKLPQRAAADLQMAAALAALSDEVGLTTSPQAAFVQAGDFPWGYLPALRPLFAEKPLLLTRVTVRLNEGQSVGALEQARFLRRLFQNAYWQGYTAVCYPDLVTERTGPSASNVALRLGNTDRPALAVWQDVLHWQLRPKLSLSLTERPAEAERAAE